MDRYFVVSAGPRELLGNCLDDKVAFKVTVSPKVGAIAETLAAFSSPCCLN